MKRRLEKSVDSELIASWRTRFAVLQHRLAQNPGGQNAWFWQLQWRIINYLLHRYAGDEIQSPPNSIQPITSVESPTIPGPAPMEVRPSDSYAASASAGKVPRRSSQVRPVLQTITQINQERYELLQRLRDEMTQAMRAERIRLQTLMHGDRTAQDSPGTIAHESPMPVLSEEEFEQMFYEFIMIDTPIGEYIPRDYCKGPKPASETAKSPPN